MRNWDTPTGYGWISIALHWVTAAIIFALWLIGSMAQAASPATYLKLVQLHVTVGLGAYLLLWARIVWRVRVGHPGRLASQGRAFFVGKVFHYILLAAIAVMLISGPLMVWSSGDALRAYGFAIPSPLPEMPGLHVVLREVHGLFGLFIFLGMVLHIAATLKHVMMDHDGTFEKIVYPPEAPAREPGPSAP